MLFVITLHRFLLLFANNYTPTSSRARASERKKSSLVTKMSLTLISLPLFHTLSPAGTHFPHSFLAALSKAAGWKLKYQTTELSDDVDGTGTAQRPDHSRNWEVRSEWPNCIIKALKKKKTERRIHRTQRCVCRCGRFINRNLRPRFAHWSRTWGVVIRNRYLPPLSEIRWVPKQQEPSAAPGAVPDPACALTQQVNFNYPTLGSNEWKGKAKHETITGAVTSTLSLPLRRKSTLARLEEAGWRDAIFFSIHPTVEALFHLVVRHFVHFPPSSFDAPFPPPEQWGGIEAQRYAVLLFRALCGSRPYRWQLDKHYVIFL